MKTKIICLLTFISLFNLFPLLSGTPDEELAEQCDQYLTRLIQQSPIPGISVAIVNSDGPILTKGYGTALMGTDRPMTADTVNAIGSLTKSFTALGILRLVDNGMVELDEPVTTYIPWFRTLDKNKSDLITVRMLLNNSSGLPRNDSWVTKGYYGEDAVEQGVRRLAVSMLSRYPGESYEYSNEGWNTLGLIIEYVTGESYGEYMQHEVIDRLGMKRSSTDYFNFSEYYADEELRWAHGCGVTEAIPVPFKDVPESLPAGSSFRSTAEDLSLYLSMLLKRGETANGRIISEQSFNQLLTPTVQSIFLPYDMGGDGTTDFYCMGWMKSRLDGKEIYHHGGNTGSNSSMTLFDPEKNIGVSILANIGTTIDSFRFDGLIPMAVDLLHIASGEETTDYGRPRVIDKNTTLPVIPVEHPEDYAGLYDDTMGRTLRISLSDQGLISEANTRSTIIRGELRFADKDLAVIHSISPTSRISFNRSSGGEVVSVEMMGVTLYKRPNRVPTISIILPDNSAEFALAETADVNPILKENRISFSENSGIILNQTARDFSALQELCFPNARVIREGRLSNRMIEDILWKEQTIVLEQDDKLIFTAILQAADRQNNRLFSAVFYGTGHDFSNILARHADILMTGFRWGPTF